MSGSDISAIQVDDAIETLLSDHRTVSHTIYVATLAFTVTGFVGAAATTVDISVRAPATLAPAIPRQTLRSLADGNVSRVRVFVGDHVQTGDTLVVLSAEPSDRAYEATQAALETQKLRRADLGALINAFAGESPAPPNPRSLRLPQSRASATAAVSEWRQNSAQVTRLQRARDRLAQLAQRGFANPADMEAAEFDLVRASEERSFATERRRAEWLEQEAAAEQQIADLEHDAAARRNEQSIHFIIAPVTGTVEEAMPLTAGTVVRLGDPVLTISPDGPLIADALVAPRDVAHLHAGMKARLIVEGYDIQEWGGLDATVTSVARDYTLSDSHPVFRVRVQPVRSDLRRANGTTAHLGKGLHCEVRFLIDKKRLGVLFRQRTSELLDPVAPTDR